MPYISRKQAHEFLAKFAKALVSPESTPLLFQVYGFGGVGKTTLTQKLKETHELQADFAEVSFGRTPGIETPLKLMEKLYELLPKPTGLWRRDLLPKPDPFTSLYDQYQQTVYKLKTQPVQGKSVETQQQNTVKDWFELGTATLLATGAGYLGDHGTALSLGLDATVKAGGMLSDASQALKPTKERIQELLQEHPATKNDKELQELMLEPIPKLTHAFAQGLIEKTQRHKRSIVLVLDTYEKASSDIDTWLWQYLLEDTPLKSYGVRILVAGRRSLLEKESWRKLQQDRDLIYEQRLDEFNKEQTKEYLQHICITKSGEIQKIYKATKGLPYYLNWIKQEKEKGKEIDFSRGNQVITDLLLQGLNPKQKQIVQLAACCRWFDRSLVQYLMQKQGIDFETGVHATIDCFDWLTKCDFVEFVQGHYRLDDVARDVFRLSFCQEDKTRFRETHELLATYFENQANQEVAPDSPEPEKYNNSDWCQYTAEFLYHALFARRDEGQRQFLSHFFASRYLKQLEVVMIPFTAVVAEAAVENYRLLPDSTEKFLKSIKLGFFFSWMMLPGNPAKYNKINYENVIGPSKEEIEAALRPCFSQVDFLEDGLGKYAGLLYKSLRSQPNQQVDLLQRATEQAEKIVTNSYPEFSSSLFLNLGNQHNNLDRNEEALVSYNRALTIQDDNPIIYYCQGNVLRELGRYEEALTSYEKALQIKNDYGNAWNNRGSVLAELEHYQEALASFYKASAIKDNDLVVLNNIAITLMILHSYQEVITICDQILKILPDEPETLSTKSLVLSLLGRYDEALGNLNKAVKLQPQSPLWWANQGIVLARAGRYQDSLASCEKALELQANDESGHYGKACYFALQNDVDLAIKNLQQAINLNPRRCRREAKLNPDFDSIRDNVRFQALLQG